MRKMCGIFGIISSAKINKKEIRILAKHAEQRGKDSSGVLICNDQSFNLHRADESITSLLDNIEIPESGLVIGHSRLITNGLADNQPVLRDGVCVIHNGIVVNHEELWKKISKIRLLEIDTEIIAAIAAEHIEKGGLIEEISSKVINMCKGTVSCAIALPNLGKLCLFSNNGSLYIGHKSGSVYFSSEQFPLKEIQCDNVIQIKGSGVVINIPTVCDGPKIHENVRRTIDLIPKLGTHLAEEAMLEYKRYTIKRCTRCILPSTMPYIHFDENGICNYCINYKSRNNPKPLDELFELVEPYRRKIADDCIVPFSGGRDSCYALHLIAKELKMKPVTYTYDWGMVTDLGRRNISRMCSEIGVENIIVADDITLKRNNIAKNLKAWLKSPHLGMISILTAGDKHFFRHVENVKKQTNISLNLWGVNPLEVTHFKAGFLGVPPDFAENKVYSSGPAKQLRYQWLRMRAMMKSPGYFNSSLWDTMSGEYYRSFAKKTDYYHIFDYWRWDEEIINDTLINQYGWETATDTKTTWRIGDGTAAFYNYIYYKVAGFTEHDTFRSNQIREGELTRERALLLVEDENRPRYPNIKWYLDAIGMDYSSVIGAINNIPRIFD